MALSYAFGGNTGQSYDELQRRRMFAESLMQRGMSSQPKTAIEGINAAASSIMGALLQRKIGAQDAANREKATQAALSIFGRPAPDVVPPNPGISTPRNPNDPVQIGNDTMAALGKTPNGWDGIKAGIFAGESGGDYNALFGFQNRPGGAFSNVQLTGMSVDDALKFADPNGQYGQHVKGQIGRVAIPMGAYQVVGTTLAAAKKGLGLRGDEIMTPALQDRIGQWIYQNQGTGAWEGYKGPQQPQGGMDPQILMAMSDPNLPPEMKSALGMLLQQRIAAAQPPEPAKPIEINNKLVDPSTGKVLGDYGDPKEPKPPETKNLTLADGSQVMVQWNPQTGAWEPAKIPEGGAGGAPPGKLTEFQSRIKLFQNMQTETQPVLTKLESQWDPANLSDPAAASIPIAGNYFTSPEYQIYSTAASAWAEGALRISTGAAATQPEIERVVGTYFAKPGDTPATVAFKTKMREMYARSIEAGQGLTPEGKLPDPNEFLKGFTPPPADTKKQPAKISSDAEYDALKSGDVFIGPDGQTRRKP